MYWLVGGSKDFLPVEAIKKKLEGVKDKLAEGLNYYKPEEKKIKEENKAPNKNLEKKQTKDKKLQVLTETLSELTGLGSDQAQYVLSSYLVNVFCGSAGTLKEIVDDETRRMNFIIDVYKFYFKERMFMLKTLNTILTTEKENVLYDICSDLIEKLTYKQLYESLYKQLKTIGLIEPPQFSSSNTNLVLEVKNIWCEHSLYEQIQICKMLIICAGHYIPPMFQIYELAKQLSKTKKKEIICSERDKGSSLHLLYMTLVQLQMLHFIQLLDFKHLPDEERWSDTDTFFLLDTRVVKFSIYEDVSAILAAWLLIHYLTPIGTKNTRKLECMAKITKDNDAWRYFNSALNTLALKDDKIVSANLYFSVFEMVYLSLLNFGVDHVKSESFCSLIAVLFREETVLNHFWTLSDHDCIHLFLRDFEKWYPVTWKPVLEIYTSVVSRGEKHYNKIVQRMKTHLKYTEIQSDTVEFKAVRANVYKVSALIRPLEYFPNVEIPADTACTLTQGNPCYIHWDISLPFWSIAHNVIRRWLKSQQSPHPCYPDTEQFAIAIIKFTTEVLKNAPVYNNDMNDMICAVEDIIAEMDRYGANKNLTMVSSCLSIVKEKEWLHLFAEDSVRVLSMLKVLPDIDKVVMTHIQCAQGLFFHSNLVKHLLELVEFQVERYPVLVSYLEFVYQLFMKQETKWSWCTLAGLVYVLNNIFPRYLKWNFTDQLERIRVGWLCVHIIYEALCVPESEIYPPKTSVPRERPKITQEITNKFEPEPSSGPTMSLFCNTALYHLLNFDSGNTLLQIIATGEDNLFGIVEKCFTWESSYCRSVVGTVECALEILDKIIVYKKFHMTRQKMSKVTPLEEKIYREPRKNEDYHVVPNLISYINHCMDHKLRYLSIKLLTRFAENIDLPLMMCIEMDPETLREMYLRPMYTDVESESIQVAVLDFVAKCIYNQASLAEAFLHAGALEKYITETSKLVKDGDTNGGILRPVVEIISSHEDESPLYEASVRLVHALWLEKRNMVLSYLRLKEDFFSNFCRPLFQSQSKIIPSHACMLDVLSYELFWFGDNVNANLKTIFENFIQEDESTLSVNEKSTEKRRKKHLTSWSVYCTEPHHGAKSGLVAADKHSKEELKLTTAWKAFIVLLSKKYEEKLSQSQKEILFLHLVNAIWLESSSMLNPDTICLLAETLLILLTQWKENCCLKKSNLLFARTVNAISNVAFHYREISSRTAVSVLSFCSRFLEYCNTKTSLPSEEDILKGAEAFCIILHCELDFIGNHNEQYKRLGIVACFSKSWILFMKKFPSQRWTELFRRYRVINMVMCITEKLLRTKQYLQQSEMILDLMACLVQTYSHIFEKVDLFPLQCSLWENLLPPSKYLHPVFTTREHSVFEGSDWTPVYCAGLRLVTAIARSKKMYVKAAAYDFILVHEECLSEIFHIVDFSLKEDDLLMILTACSLLNEVFKHPGKWSQLYIRALQNIMAHVGQCMEKVGNLLNMPTSLASRILRFERNLNDPVELPQHEVCDRTQKVQKRLLSLYIACLSVLKCMCPDYSDIVSADPLGIELDTICPHFIPTTTIEELITLVGSVNLFTKSLAKTQNVKASPHSPTPQIQSPVTDEYSLLNRLPECSESDIHLALELSLHYLISSVLTFIYFNRVNSRQQVLFIRDLSSELSLFVEYVRRLCIDISAVEVSDLMVCKRPDPLIYTVVTEDESDVCIRTDGEIRNSTVVPETDESMGDSYEEENLQGYPKGPQFLILAAQLLKQIFNLVEKPQQ